jgi:hypothetical protein
MTYTTPIHATAAAAQLPNRLGLIVVSRAAPV